MKSLTIAYASGEHEDFTVEDTAASEAVAALSRQDAAHPIPLSETATVYVNMRQVTTLAVGAEEDVSESDEGEPEDTRTVAQLKEALDAAKVEYDPKALKAELLELAKTSGV